MEELTKGRARLDEVRRLCAWVEPLVHSGPWTGEGDLFGQCLGECTAEHGKNVRRRENRQRDRKKVSHAAGPDRAAEKKRAWTCQFPPAEKQPRQPIDPCSSLPETLGLPKRASQELLCALATSIVSSDREELQNSLQSGNAEQSFTRSGNFLKFCSELPADPPAQESKPATPHDPLSGIQASHLQWLVNVWRENISWRASQALQLASLTLDESGEPKLMEHWGVPIAGPEAPPDILTVDSEFDIHDSARMRNGETQAPAVSEIWETGSVDSPPQQTEEKDPRGKVGLPADSMKAGAERESEQQRRETQRDFPGSRELGAGAWNSDWRATDLLRDIFLGHESLLPHRFDAHALVPTLMAPGPNSPSATTQSRKQIDHETWQAGLTEQDELHDLSQKLQRILEDEARRFGVNV